MKATYGIWAVLAVLALMTAGFIPAIILTGLAVTSSITTGLAQQNKSIGSSAPRKSLY